MNALDDIPERPQLSASPELQKANSSDGKWIVFFSETVESPIHGFRRVRARRAFWRKKEALSFIDSINQTKPNQTNV